MNSKIKNRLTPILFAVITAAVITAAVVSVCVGKYTITTADIQAILKGEQVQEMTRNVFTTLRLPRTVMALIAGVGLGIAGSVYQIIFKNPLASPDIIGIAGGANLGAAVAIVSVSTSGMIAIAAGAFWGGLIAVVCVMLLVKATRSRSTSTYVLAGIVINAISKAVIMALKYFADPENELAAMEYWEMGTFGNTTLSKLLSILPMFLIGLAGILLLRRQIELMSLSDNECRALGVRLRPVRAAVLALSTLMVGSIISVTGLISFAGLIAPHTARLMLRRNDSTTIIMSGLVGAFVVLTADILARVLYSAELPISILTTVIGVPILIYFLCARGKDVS
ncbi:MAG: iron ABC transporter permease [Clostridiales bacterium]|nr:iron ABC transporter permease [Clostridiales bacterium]MDD7444223.1 iron ABC transporter permease [Clostridiales bacterium]MDY2951739.1 iron ABC transporter permease [Eubacteriales bacterium]